MFAPNMAGCVLASTLALNTFWTWPMLPYFPIEFSQMGWGIPGRSGGYHIMSIGLSTAATIMFRVHVEERSLLGAVGAVCMCLLGLINGNDAGMLQMLHGIVAFTCFVIYIVYIGVYSCADRVFQQTWNPVRAYWRLLTFGGPVSWVAVAFTVLIIGHVLVLTEVRYAEVIELGFPAFWTKAQQRHGTSLLRFKALLQYAMIVSLCSGYFSIASREKVA
jgi:hypothetical protein